MTLILVVGSVQVELEEEEEVEDVVVHVIAVLVVVVWLQEVRPNRPTNNAKNARRFTAPLSPRFRTSRTIRPASFSVLKLQNSFTGSALASRLAAAEIFS